MGIPHPPSPVQNASEVGVQREADTDQGFVSPLADACTGGLGSLHPLPEVGDIGITFKKQKSKPNDKIICKHKESKTTWKDSWATSASWLPPRG